MPKGPTPRLNALIAKVNAVCERKHGSKVELAEYLQTTKQQVYALLKGENEPGGERVLALLEWLEKNSSAT
jgi:hypothetical protein